MNKRIAVAVVAAVFAIAGVIALVVYANGAKTRAYDDAKLVAVLQVQKTIPAGTDAAKIGDAVETVKVPSEFRVDGALISLDSVASLSTNATLEPGEQLLKSRFGAKTDQKGSSKAVEVPEGYQELSISIGAPRAVAGQLKVGDKVGILATYGDQTTFLGQQVLVSRVSGAPAGNDQSNANASLLVTFAVKTIDAKKIVNASEAGKVWLTLQNDNTDEGKPRPIGAGDILK